MISSWVFFVIYDISIFAPASWRQVHFRLNPEKYLLFKLKYLGHIVDRWGLRTEKVKVIGLLPQPFVRYVIIGLVSWYWYLFHPKFFDSHCAVLTQKMQCNAGDTNEEKKMKRPRFASSNALSLPRRFSHVLILTAASSYKRTWTPSGWRRCSYFEEGERSKTPRKTTALPSSSA